MRHSNDDLAQAQLAAALDDLLHRGDQAFTAIKAEPLGAHVFYMQKLLKAFCLNQLVEDRFTAFTCELDFFAQTLDALF